jgi:hypothetical protein
MKSQERARHLEAGSAQQAPADLPVGSRTFSGPPGDQET